jgi:predicted PurR-regulated permease PerM
MQWMRKKLHRHIVFFLVVIATFYFLYLIRDVVFSFLAGGVLAYLLYHPVRLVEAQGIKRVWVIIMIYVLIIALVILALWFAIPHLVNELSGLVQVLPEYTEKARELADRINGMHLPGKLDQIMQENMTKIENHIYHVLKSFIAGFYTLLSKALIIIFAPILAFYILIDWEKIRDAFLKLLPPAARREITVLAGQIDQVVIEFIKGHLLVALCVGVLIGLAAALMEVRFALLIGIISGISELVPYFGPLLGGIPAVGLALSQSLHHGLYMALAIIIIQQIESHIITPKILGDRLGMHPLLIVFALLAGGKLWGVGGMLIAVPLTAALNIILSYMYLKVVEN